MINRCRYHLDWMNKIMHFFLVFKKKYTRRTDWLSEYYRYLKSCRFTKTTICRSLLVLPVYLISQKLNKLFKLLSKLLILNDSSKSFVCICCWSLQEKNLFLKAQIISIHRNFIKNEILRNFSYDLMSIEIIIVPDTNVLCL